MDDKLSKLYPSIPAEELDLPVSLDAFGQPVTLREALSALAEGTKALPHAMTFDPERERAVAIERISRTPDFDVHMIGAGHFDRERAIAEIEQDSPEGRHLVHLESRVVAKVLTLARRDEARRQGAQQSEAPSDAEPVR